MPLPLDSHSTILGCLHHYARAQPQARAYTFVADGERDDKVLSYGELDERSTRLARRLIGSANDNPPAILLYPSGLDFIIGFFACLKARVVAVPANLTRNQQHFARLHLIIKDSGARLILTTPALKRVVQDGLARADVDECIFTFVEAAEEAEEGGVDTVTLPEVLQDDLAFLQYTSGSTGAPKGVMVTHGQLMANERAIQRSADLPEHVEGGGWLPQFHDMGLIGATLQPVALGGHYAFMSPLHFIQRPLRWLEMISRFGTVASAAPNFALDLCLKAAPPSAGAESLLDLHRLKTIFCGAEPVNADVVRRFVERFQVFGMPATAVRPCYGLAECTLLVSGGGAHQAPPVLRLDRQAQGDGQVVRSDAADALTSVCCGSVPDHHQVVVVDVRAGERVSADSIGEVWVRGPSVASGYWQKPEATRNAFGAYLRDGTGTFMRTGDLGFTYAGGLYITGRLKEMMIVRGRNYYPSDIEQTLMEALGASWPGCCAVFATETAGTERVVAILELARKQKALDPDELSRTVGTARQAVARVHELQLAEVLVLAHACIPRTTSGKTQRLHCAQLYREGAMHCLWRRLRRGAEEMTPIEKSTLANTF